MLATSLIVLNLLNQTFVERELAWDQSQHPNYPLDHYVVTMSRMDTMMMFQRGVTTRRRLSLLWPRKSDVMVQVHGVFKREDGSEFEMSSTPMFVQTESIDSPITPLRGSIVHVWK